MIRFPKVSIASSVVNRILNVHEEVEARQAMAQPLTQPSSPNVPDTAATGEALNQQLYQPTQPVSTDDPAIEDALTLKSVL